MNIFENTQSQSFSNTFNGYSSPLKLSKTQIFNPTNRQVNAQQAQPQSGLIRSGHANQNFSSAYLFHSNTTNGYSEHGAQPQMNTHQTQMRQACFNQTAYEPSNYVCSNVTYLEVDQPQLNKRNSFKQRKLSGDHQYRKQPSLNSPISAKFSDSTGYTSMGESDCSYNQGCDHQIDNFIDESSTQYCEATRGAKKKVFINNEERQQFKQQYESKKKTELCRNFQMYGVCKFGNSCSYAHGKHQLQKKTHLPSNFMTKLCTQFHQDGFCTYGERCQFLHSIYDRQSELTYTQALKEGARLTHLRNEQIGDDSGAECLWANLKTGDGCGAPKKPRLAVFEEIYNKEDYNNKQNEEVAVPPQVQQLSSIKAFYPKQNKNVDYSKQFSLTFDQRKQQYGGLYTNYMKQSSNKYVQKLNFDDLREI